MDNSNLQEKLNALQQLRNAGLLTDVEHIAKINTLINPVNFVTNIVNFFKWLFTSFNLGEITLMVILGIGMFLIGERYRIPIFNFGPNSLESKSASVVLPGTPDTLKLDTAGHLTVVDTKFSKKISTVNISDIKGVNDAIHPIGLEFKPFLAGGMSTGMNGVKPNVGLGAHVFHIYNWQTDGLITNNGIFAGESYRLSKFLGGNSSIGIGAGPEFKGGLGALVYVTIDF